MSNIDHNRWIAPDNIETGGPFDLSKPLLDGLIRDVQPAGFERRIRYRRIFDLVVAEEWDR